MVSLSEIKAPWCWVVCEKLRERKKSIISHVRTAAEGVD